MGSRLKSAIIAAAIQGGLAYALIVGLQYSMQPKSNEKLATIDIAPPPKDAQILPPVPKGIAAFAPPAGFYFGRAVKPLEWASAGALQREAAFTEIQRWRDDNMSEDDKRIIAWRKEVPQGSGPGRVTRLRPDNLSTHTLYWPAAWSKGPLPIVAWGNGQYGMCANSSLHYAGLLSEIASYGYFVVAVGNDDIDYPQPEGIEILADGRPVRTQASALRKAVDWAVAENGREGSPFAGKIDTGKIVYMGHGCGAQQAMSAASDPRTTTAVLLEAPTRSGSESGKPAIVHFDGWEGRRWTRAILAWLDKQLKAESNATPVPSASAATTEAAPAPP